ncbi:MAG: hypothetical protein DRJ42_23610 [Deltaproteobacteria bacterium]|nr:MAG: hypothetical protein DRJ42_23610 [Deltaproteobacteria bacterium]
MQLRTYTVLDTLQPQLTGFLQTVAPGFQPLEGMCSLFVEIAPGIAINRITDAALKHTRVLPGMQIVERSFGLLEVHHEDQGEVREAGRFILEKLGCTESDRLKPKIISEEIITGITGHQEMILNRMRHGDMIREGETLYVLETYPAAYAALAANEAEKAADIRLMEVLTFGAFGRLYLGGGEADIEEAAKAVRRALDGIDGVEEKR